ncbi:MAG: DNA-3-methyladenine glycosylase [Dehalococcoidia bacterium]|nr:DNA-3-methyladenine glycosylase [Dehalococcoidia bacterium]
MADPARCFWANDDPLMARYHDEEWGTPLHDDRGLFEFLVLDTPIDRGCSAMLESSGIA